MREVINTQQQIKNCKNYNDYGRILPQSCTGHTVSFLIQTLHGIDRLAKLEENYSDFGMVQN